MYRLARVEWLGRAATLTHTAQQHLTLTLADDVAITVDRLGRVDLDNFGNFRFSKRKNTSLQNMAPCCSLVQRRAAVLESRW